MTAASGVGFPGGRTLAGWWGQLAAFRPRRLWVGHLLLHQVEALAGQTHDCPLDALSLSLLQALTLSAAETLDRLDQRLHLGRQVLARALAELRREGLAQEIAGSWQLTDQGQKALAEGRQARTRYERRTFVFLDDAGPDHRAHFLHVNTSAAVAQPVGEDWQFDPEALPRCLGQPPAWKEQFGFPPEIEKILNPLSAPADSSETPAHLRVFLDRPTVLAVAVIQTAEPDGERLLGFGVRPENWQLLSAEPAFAVQAGSELFPELAADPPLEAWRQAWLDWGQARNLPVSEAEACPLERVEHRLRVVVKGRLLDKLRSTRSDALRGDAWLLAGTARLRPAAQIEVIEDRP
jgi:hypothetical protein